MWIFKENFLGMNLVFFKFFENYIIFNCYVIYYFYLIYDFSKNKNMFFLLVDFKELIFF